jgi:hypothetical protein
MLFKTRIPPYPLSGYVELLIYFEGYNPAYSIERILREGVIDVIIDLTEVSKYIYMTMNRYGISKRVGTHGYPVCVVNILQLVRFGIRVCS